MGLTGWVAKIVKDEKFLALPSSCGINSQDFTRRCTGSRTLAHAALVWGVHEPSWMKPKTGPFPVEIAELHVVGSKLYTSNASKVKGVSHKTSSYIVPMTWSMKARGRDPKGRSSQYRQEINLCRFCNATFATFTPVRHIHTYGGPVRWWFSTTRSKNTTFWVKTKNRYMMKIKSFLLLLITADLFLKSQGFCCKNSCQK